MGRRRSVLVWIALALGFLGLVGSRLIVPDGPWEQDEAIFATAVLDFDIPHHRPHPPGFPAWIALGKLANLVIGDPLLALRSVSAGFSIVTVVLLVDLLRRRVGLPIAVASALLYAFLPGVWAHASRAFSTTPAVALAVAAVWLWDRGSPRALIGSWIALVLAAFVRPQLLPVLAVLAAAGCIERRRPWTEVRDAIAIAALVGLAIVGVVLYDAGGVRGIWRAFDQHLSSHVGHSRARTWPPFGDLGIVRALGGPGPASAWFLVVVAGCFVCGRTKIRWGLWSVALVGAALFTILVLHNPAHPRYSIPVLAAGVPCVAAVASLRRNWGFVLTVMAMAGAAWVTAPAIGAMHAVPLPPVAALRSWAATAAPGQPLVFAHGLFSFARYEHMSGRLPGPILDSSRVSEKDLVRLREPWAVLSGVRSSVLPGVTVEEVAFDEFPPAAWDVSQRRFERAHLVHNPVLIRSGAFAVERNSRHEEFAWLGSRVRMLAPAGAQALHLVLDVDGKRAPLGLRVTVDGRLVETRTLERGSSSLSITLTDDDPAVNRPRSVELTVLGAQAAEGGSRLLSARLYGAWATGPRFRVAPATFSPGQPHAALAQGAELSGFFAPERFTAERRPGAWTRGDALIRFPAEPGTVTVTLAQPPPRDGEIRLDSDAETIRVQADARPRPFSLRVAGTDRTSFVRIRSATAIPAAGGKARDQRSLGAIVFEVEYRPDRASK